MDVRRRLGAALGLVALLGATRAAAASSMTLHYDVYFLALRVVSADVASRVDEGRYRATVALRAVGLLSMLGSWVSEARTAGVVDGEALRPASYRVDSAYRDRQQRIDLEYDPGGTVRSDVEGVLSDGERDDVPARLRSDTVDPVTAGAMLAQRLATAGTCAGTLHVFDGLRRYDLRYEDLGEADLAPSSRDAYRGAARLCRGHVEPIAGFLRSGEHAGEQATDVSAWLAPPVPGAPPATVRMDVAGTRGTLHVHLARATIDPPGAAASP